MNHQKINCCTTNVLSHLFYCTYFTIGKLILKKKLTLKHSNEFLVLKYTCLCYQVPCDYWKINFLIFPKPLSLRLKENDSFELQKYYISTHMSVLLMNKHGNKPDEERILTTSTAKGKGTGSKHRNVGIHPSLHVTHTENAYPFLLCKKF